MRTLTFRRPLPPERGAARQDFLRGLATGFGLPPEQARFILAVVRQYENQGLSWQELVGAAYAGWREAFKQQTDASIQPNRLGAW